jgi:hypothetical protein
MENQIPDDETHVTNDETYMTNQLHVNCPVCDDQISMDALIPHLMIAHPRFFVVWSSYTLPGMMLNDTIDEDLFNDYNYLMNLCESIGYHKEGITDIEEVAPLTVQEQNNAHNEKCPICMEELYQNDPSVRVVKKCNHGFCADCIEKWLKENKTCPICVQWLQEDPDTLPSLEEVD